MTERRTFSGFSCRDCAVGISREAALPAEVGQGGVTVLVQVPAGPGAGYGGVLVRHSGGLAVRERGQTGVRAHVTR